MLYYIYVTTSASSVGLDFNDLEKPKENDLMNITFT